MSIELLLFINAVCTLAHVAGAVLFVASFIGVLVMSIVCGAQESLEPATKVMKYINKKHICAYISILVFSVAIPDKGDVYKMLVISHLSSIEDVENLSGKSVEALGKLLDEYIEDKNET